MNFSRTNFDLFDSPELLEIQRTGFYDFLNQGIPELLAKEFPIKVKNGNYSLELSLNEKNIKLIAPEDDPRECILKMKTYNCKLYAQVKIVCKRFSSSSSYNRLAKQNKISQEANRFLGRRATGDELSKTEATNFAQALPPRNKEKIIYQSSPEWVLLGQLPMMTKRGHFIINGSPRVIVHQVVRAPGIYFQKIIKKDDQNKARFYGDIIPLKGVWVRLQMTKKGRVEAKFKKGKKIEVELLQKCLQVIENQTLFGYGLPSNKRSSGDAFLTDQKPVSEEKPRFLRQDRWKEGPMHPSLPSCSGIQRFVLQNNARKDRGTGGFTRREEGFTSFNLNNKDSRFLSYDDYSKLLDKKKSRAESKAEHDAFVHTYDKLYRTTQDKELEEWQKKKKNQNYFKSSPKQLSNPNPLKEIPELYKESLCKGNKEKKKLFSGVCKANRKRNQASSHLQDQSFDSSYLSENAFKRKKCSENLFATFKLQSRYDLGLLGREKINNKFGLICKSFASACKSWRQSCAKRSFASPEAMPLRAKICMPNFAKQDKVCQEATFRRCGSTAPKFGFQKRKVVDRFSNQSSLRNRNVNTQLTSLDLCSATLWLYKLRKGEQNSDDIDHSQNRRVRTSGDLLQTQFENGVYRLKNLLSTKLQEWRGDLSSSVFSSIFQFSWKTRYRSKNASLKGSERAKLSYFEEKSFITALSWWQGLSWRQSRAKRSFASPKAMPLRANLRFDSKASCKSCRLIACKSEICMRSFAQPCRPVALSPSGRRSKVEGRGSKGEGRRVTKLRFDRLWLTKLRFVCKAKLCTCTCKPLGARSSNLTLDTDVLTNANASPFKRCKAHCPSLCKALCARANQDLQTKRSFVSRRRSSANLLAKSLVSQRRQGNGSCKIARRRANVWPSCLVKPMRKGALKMFKGNGLKNKGVDSTPILPPISSLSIALPASQRQKKERAGGLNLRRGLPCFKDGVLKLSSYKTEACTGKMFFKKNKNKALINEASGEQERSLTGFDGVRGTPVSLQSPCRLVAFSSSTKQDKICTRNKSSGKQSFTGACVNPVAVRGPSCLQDQQKGKANAKLLSNRRFVKQLHLGEAQATPKPRFTKNQSNGASLGGKACAKLRMQISDLHANPPGQRFLAKELFSTKPITGALREFFGSNPLSQYMDQTNPLAEITHKRRISSLGIGGVSRESAGMAIRGIHPTHYGRICPIETPEGKNAGLVNSLAFYTKVDKNGFLKTPYYRVFKGQIQPSLGFSFCSAKEESLTGLQIAPSDLQRSSNNILRTRSSTPESVPVRVADNLLDVFKKENPYKVQLIAISPIQMISVATSLIPFLEHNDANRALMGSNMQRQAVPLMISERPVVGTGLESTVIVESGHITESQVSGFASHVAANKVVVDTLFSTKREDSSSLFFKASLYMATDLSHFFKLKSSNTQNRKISAMHLSQKIDKVSLDLLTEFACKRKAFRLPSTNLALQSPENKSFASANLLAKRSFALDSKASHANLRFARKPLRARICKKQGSPNKFSSNELCICNKPKARIFIRGRRHQTQLKQSFTSGFVNKAIKKFQGSILLAGKTLGPLQGKKGQDCTANALFSSLTRREAINQPVRLQHKALYTKRSTLCSLGSNTSLIYNQETQKRANKSYSFLNLQNQGWYSSQSSFLLGRLACTKKERCIQKKHLLISTVSPLTIFSRSNQNTCITEKPLVREFDWVQKGDILSDSSASNNGELAVGKNVLLAYIPWEGYNFEDAIVISERLVREHVYTSLHIERYVFQAQDLKDGNEWFTKNLPGVEPRSIQHLEESGLPKVGSFLKEGDIIVGKIRYLNKKPSSPYERLLCDILGEKNFAARNKSLYVPKGVEARVIYHKIVSVFDNDPENKVRPIEAAKTVHLFLGEKRVIQVGDKISGRHGNKGVISTILPRQDMPYLPDGTPIDIILNPLGVPSRMNVGQVLECLLGLAATYLHQHFKITAFDERYGVEASKSIVFLKLYQARLQSGQNWLFQVAFPGKTRLVDGRSGECFDQWITVGRAYILKLIHMVSEKIHARSTGPYALITQQPLRGRSNKGGQRLGEMEVWALEGFGAAYTLQELLTKKSDDFFGRKQIVDSILPNPASVVDTLKPSNRIDQNRNILGHPEIFKVLLCELQALCLDLGVYIVTPDSFQRNFLGVVH